MIITFFSNTGAVIKKYSGVEDYKYISIPHSIAFMYKGVPITINGTYSIEER